MINNHYKAFSQLISSRNILLSIILLLVYSNLKGQVSTLAGRHDSINRNRLDGVIIAGSVIGIGSLVGLYSLWYADYPRSGFHFINDNTEWLGMDKTGHAMTSYYLGKVGYESLKWAGVNEKKSTWYGGLTGLIYLGAVEVFDGFSEEWGASPGDMAANTIGTALFIGQQLGWHEQFILLKWSYHATEYAQYNETQLGRNLPQRMLKDYNGQTYWLSANLHGLAGCNDHLPKWLNIAFGYGAEGMTGANRNPEDLNGLSKTNFQRYSQFYLAPDIDLTRIPTKSKNLKLLLNLIGFIKFPMPAIEYNKHGFKFHYLYF
jgi:hypothetical protein